MRLIDADAIGLNDFEIIMCDGDYKEALKMLLGKIDAAPTIEERKTGQWIVSENPDEGWKNLKCPFCEKTMSYYIHTEARPNFCINCGARMET